jgi:hypothetical protein
MTGETIAVIIGGLANVAAIFGGFRLILKDSLSSEHRLTHVETKLDNIGNDVADIKRVLFNGNRSTSSK